MVAFVCQGKDMVASEEHPPVKTHRSESRKFKDTQVNFPGCICLKYHSSLTTVLASIYHHCFFQITYLCVHCVQELEDDGSRCEETRLQHVSRHLRWLNLKKGSYLTGFPVSILNVDINDISIFLESPSPSVNTNDSKASLLATETKITLTKFSF